MSISKLSLRSSIILVLACIGLLGLGMAALTGATYRSLILDNEKSALHDMVELESQRTLSDYREILESFSIDIQQEKKFIEHFHEGLHEHTRQHLNDQFFQYYVTAGVVNVAKIYAYDRDYQLLTTSTADERGENSEQICPGLLSRATGRKGIDRIKTLGDFCVDHGKTYYAAVTPIGSLSPRGYLMFVTEPANIFINLEKTLGLPLKIFENDATFYQSKRWTDALHSDQSFAVSHALHDSRGNETTLQILVARDISLLNQRLNETRNLIMAGGASIMLLTILAMIRFLGSSTLRPLRQLTRQLLKMRNDKDSLGETIQVNGHHEIQTLAEGFNSMSRQLGDLYQHLENMAYRDALTSLPNRSLLQQQLQLQTRQNQIQGLPFALFMMDLDRFKQVNDTLGHHAGDMLLQQVSHRLARVLRRSDSFTTLQDEDKKLLQQDSVARLGGDEFAAVLPTVGNEKDAMLIAQKIIGEMEQPFNVDGCNFSIGVSIGIVLCPEHGEDGETLLRHADVAMYHAKTRGLGYHIYTEQSDHNSIDLLTREEELRRAIENDELQLYYQPKIDLRENRIVGAEALLRWPHPAKGMIMPDQFIPIAEQTGLIHNLSQWVIGEAVRTLSHWQESDLYLSLSINLSARNLLDQQLGHIIENQLDSQQVVASRLYLELTETAVMADPQRALLILKHLDEIGVKLSIDDFGTGYSSLSYLKKMPVDEIKIDRSFVMDMLNNQNDRIIVQSIIDLATNMGLAVTAEGVENQSTQDFLRRAGCTLAQGYHIARPLPLEEFNGWLLTNGAR